MSKLFRLLCVVALFSLALLISGMIYVVYAKYQLNDYNTELSMAFNAAMLVNAQTTYTDAEHAVIASYGDARVLVAPENYRFVQNYFKRQAVAIPISLRAFEDALVLTFCGESALFAVPDADLQGATVRFQSSNKHYTMHVSSPDLWEKMLDACLTGTNQVPNIAL